MYVHIPIKILGACQFIKLPSEMLTTYKNPQTIIQTLPDSVIETLFRLVSTAFPTLTFCNIARSPQLLKWGMNCTPH